MLADIGLALARRALRCRCPRPCAWPAGSTSPPGCPSPTSWPRWSGWPPQPHRGADLVCFAGAGAYDHEVPSATTRLTFRSEFVTAYTPYQPEVAQGVLQALFEYQTLVARLAGLPVANASLYDGASAAVEAVNLAVAAKGRQTVWVSGGIHPHWRQVLATFAAGTGHELVDVPLRDGVTDWAVCAGGRPAGRPAGGSPNYLGALEDIRAARAAADRQGALLLVGFDPVSAGLLRAPGEDGADVVVGEGQPFGTPLSFGGPYLGLFSCRHGARPPPAGPPGRPDRRHRGPPGLRDHPAGPGTGHPPGEGLVQRVHQPDPDRGGRHDPAVVAGHHRAAGAGPALRPGHPLHPGGGCSPSRASSLWPPRPTLREFALRLPVPAETVVARMAEEGSSPGSRSARGRDGARRRRRPAGGRHRDGGPGRRSTRYASALEKVVR